MTFAVGSTIVTREVLHGRTWLELPGTVVADDGTTLATMITDGAPLTHHPEHPFGPHPWARNDTWVGPTVLSLRRAGDWYAVEMFFDGATFRHWYVNFEQPYERTADGIVLDDLQLDLVVEPDGTRRWKDVDHLGPCLASGRIDADQVRAVLDAAATVTALLDDDERWWAAWDAWTP